MIEPSDILAYVIRPTLHQLGLHSAESEALILGTIAHESDCGRYLHQVRGPAIGICQMEPATHALCWRWVNIRRPELRDPLQRLTVDRARVPEPEEMAWNLRYAVAMARILYLSIPKPLPAAWDIQGQANYYKAHYNSPAGKARPEQYVAAWNTYRLSSVLEGSS